MLALQGNQLRGIMKIDGPGNRQPLASPTRPKPESDFATAMASAAAPVPAGIDVPKSADFTRMSRKELFDWMNAEIRGGRLSLDDSSGLLSLAARGPLAADSAVPDDTMRCDFVSLARDGIETARLRPDPGAQAMLETAMAVMLRAQGGGSRVSLTG